MPETRGPCLLLVSIRPNHLSYAYLRVISSTATKSPSSTCYEHGQKPHVSGSSHFCTSIAKEEEEEPLNLNEVETPPKASGPDTSSGAASPPGNPTPSQTPPTSQPFTANPPTITLQDFERLARCFTDQETLQAELGSLFGPWAYTIRKADPTANIPYSEIDRLVKIAKFNVSHLPDLLPTQEYSLEHSETLKEAFPLVVKIFEDMIPMIDKLAPTQVLMVVSNDAL
jgi:hypothetical protein